MDSNEIDYSADYNQAISILVVNFGPGVEIDFLFPAAVFLLVLFWREGCRLL